MDQLLVEEIEEEQLIFGEDEEDIIVEEVMSIEDDDSHPTAEPPNEIIPPTQEKRKRSCRRLSVENHKNSNRSKVIQTALREKGQEYLGTKKLELNEGGDRKWNWDYKVKKGSKAIQERCNCRLSIKDTVLECSKLSEENRNEIHSQFWQLDWKEKRIFVCNNMTSDFTERVRHRANEDETRRTYSFKFFLPVGDRKFRVCRNMFLNTLCIGRWQCQNWKIGTKKKISPTLSHTKATRPSISSRMVKCEEFLDGLVKMESHYCRKTTTKLFLEPLWNSSAELYRFYVTTMNESDDVNGTVSQCAFDKLLEKKNLSIYKRRKDECETCLSFRQKNVESEEYQSHLALKDEARAEKQKDKENTSHKVFTMDVQAVLLSPLNKSSAMYYKTKLVTHNFTVHNIHSKDAWCYVFNEANATLHATTFASMICDFLINHSGCTRGDTVIIFSDGCTYQNRNVQLSNALLNLSMETGISIVQKFLVKGHTQMEVDSVHSTIEAAYRNKEVNVPSDYCRFMREARLRQPYTVKYLDYTFFKKFDDVNFYSSIRPPPVSPSFHPKVTDIRVLKYCPSGELLFKTNFKDDYKRLAPQRAATRTSKLFKFVPFSSLPAMYEKELSITKKKYDHLMALLPSIPKDFHSFYKNLTFTAAKKRKSEKAMETETRDE